MILEKILEKSKRLILGTDISFIRDIYFEIDWSARLIWIVWQRWIWKTTILLQYLKKENIEKSIYFSADNINLIEVWIYTFVEKLYLENGIKVFFIDEIHKSKNWNAELKNLYDDFPEIKIVFSGSSSIDLIKWKYDLSRRVLLYKMKWFSFKEYVNKVKNIKLENYEISEILKNSENIVNNIYKELWDEILVLFNRYLRFWYYPFNFESDKIESFNKRLFEVIDKLVYEDISNFYKMDSTNLEKLKKIIIFFSLSKPWELSVNSIKNKLWISFDTAANYLQILNDVWILRGLYVEWNISKSIRKAKKLYIDNSNLIYTISNETWIQAEIWTVREIFFINQLNKNLFYSDIWDFMLKIWLENYYFEIWWKNKKRKQLQNKENSFIVADSIIFPTKWKIPIWLFGFIKN